MTKLDKVKNNVTSYKDELHTDLETIKNSYVIVYINYFIKKFRNKNSDKFIITITGLVSFIDDDNKTLKYLFEQLEQNNFNLVFTGKKDNIYEINVAYTNVTKNTSCNFKYQIQNLINIIELSSKTDIPIAGIFIMKIIAQIISKSKILYKAIVLDLDDTLWHGNLAEVGINNISKFLSSDQGIPFIAFMKFCSSLANELGIYIALCSRNDSNQVENAIKAQLPESLFPLKNQIDCIVANNNNKSDNIQIIAKELDILPESIVFIDDNKIIRDEVKNKLPNVFVPEWSNHDELSTQLIIGCIFDRIELSFNSQNRKKQGKIIQTERSKNSLPELFIKVISDNNHIESRRLYSKSNQFKISANDEEFDKNAKSCYFEIHRKNGENLGICSAITYTISDKTITLINWAISCRYFQIGIEEFILLYLRRIANKILITYHESGNNLKVKEMLEKYCNVSQNDGQGFIAIIEFTEDTVNKLIRNTNLREAQNG